MFIFLISQSQPPDRLRISAASESLNSASRDSFSFSISQETLSNEDVVEIETGDGDVLAVLNIIASSIPSRSHKSSPIRHRICLVCHGLGIDKSISVGKDYSNTPLVAHFQTKHKDKFKEYLSLKEAQSLQSHSHLKAKSDACF